MKITIVATHSFPIPYPNLHTGDLVILNLAKALAQLGHDVTMVAPEGTEFPKLLPMRASLGSYPPSSEQCEVEAFKNHGQFLLTQDIVHDFSNTKCIAAYLNVAGFKNTLTTIMGGAWKQEALSRNLITWSKSHQNRVLRGATDYEGTSTPDLAGDNGYPSVSHVVHGGIDTGFYTPSYDKEDFFLWSGRWHNVRGYDLAIAVAQKTGIQLVLAGEHPDNELFQSQRDACHHAMKLAEGYSNIRVEFLPSDPDHHVAKRKLLRQAKALLYTVQFHEPFGLSQVEALACGTPVLAPKYGSCPELIVDGKTGFICDNTVNAYAEAVSRVSELSPEVCRKNAVSRFDYRVMAQNYLTEYKKVLNGDTW